jgi:hypothetical protein
MKRWKLAVIIIIALVLVGTYAIYAMIYQGNYNVTAKVTLYEDNYGTPSIFAFSTTNEQTSPTQFWDLFKGHSLPDNTSKYMIYWEMDTSLWSHQGMAVSGTIDYGAYSTTSFTIGNVEPGIYTMDLIVKDNHGATVLTHSYEVTVGP